MIRFRCMKNNILLKICYHFFISAFLCSKKLQTYSTHKEFFKKSGALDAKVYYIKIARLRQAVIANDLLYAMQSILRFLYALYSLHLVYTACSINLFPCHLF